MKNVKKLVAFMLTLAMILSMGAVVFADNSATTKGSIEVMNPQTGVTYTASKIFGVTYDGDKYSYTIDSASPWFETVSNFAGAADDADGLTLTQVGSSTTYTVSFTDDFSASDFAAAMKEATVTDTEAVTLTVAEGATNPKAENLPLGYYLVLPSNGALANLTTTNADVQIYDKNEVPEVIKEISNETDDKNVSEASVGDEIPYTLTTKVPDMTGYKTYFFVMKDKLSKGLTLNVAEVEGSDPVTHTGISVTLDGVALVEGTGYDVKVVENADGTTNLSIIFKNMVGYMDENNYKVGAPIVVTYSATLDEDAVVNNPSTNDVYMQYSSDPSITPTYDPEDPPENTDDPDDPKWTNEDPTGEGPHSTTKTYTTELTIQKTDGTNPLTGAKFKLEGTSANKVKVTADVYTKLTTDPVDGKTYYYLLKDGNYTTEPPILEDNEETHVKANADKYASTTDLYEKGVKEWFETKAETPEVVEVFVGSDGKAVFTGLGAGTYTLTEVVTPDGYNPIAPKTITIVFDEAVTTAEDGTKTYGTPKFYINEEAKDTDEDGKKDDGFTMSMDVVNTTGTVLPQTGGIGTTIFYVLGSILLVGAAVLLITKKRMSVNE